MFTIWLTGLPCSGKSTLAVALKTAIDDMPGTASVQILDGDEVRTNLCPDLGFSKEDRRTNNLRLGWISKMLNDHGVISIVAAVSPYIETRAEVRSKFGARTAEGPPFCEVFVNCPLSACERRDTKGMYARARAGEIANFTGISDPYEPPFTPEAIVYSSILTVEQCVNAILRVTPLAQESVNEDTDSY